MLDVLFQSVFTNTAASLRVPQFLLSIGVSLVIGILLSLVYTYKSHHTKSFVVTLALLPAVVCMIIMMVNGNVGTGVAVAGAFSLVRFRSVPGTAREIGTIFLAMGAGLATGMGYLGYALLFTVIVALAMLLLTALGFGGKKSQDAEKTLRITIPEDLNYSEVFDDIFAQYTCRWEMASAKTTNMGSLFKLCYRITLKDSAKEKEFIDALRCRNGNLEISIAREEAEIYEL
ncbi:MAG: DUF4956 domain-containing protein [Muribaculaceae bacterium]|nr:DUF4956 domain-containing protein [Roseburia sp.]MCM1432071.1 DUF4956 domain-containing protein [Muribaculaceae bacterium]MCM1492129.1 DUF4956 domain-containing protein [Muribaculaceae bacterium]